MTGDQLVHPGEAVEVVPVKLAQCRRSHHGEGPFRTATEHRPVRHVGQAGDRQRSGAHRVREIAARRRLRRDAESQDRRFSARGAVNDVPDICSV
jgi:hypothetical protein